MLLETGAVYPNPRAINGDTPLHDLIQNDHHINNPGMLKILMEYGVDPSIKNKQGISPCDLYEPLREYHKTTKEIEQIADENGITVLKRALHRKDMCMIKHCIFRGMAVPPGWTLPDEVTRILEEGSKGDIYPIKPNLYEEIPPPLPDTESSREKRKLENMLKRLDSEKARTKSGGTSSHSSRNGRASSISHPRPSDSERIPTKNKKARRSSTSFEPPILSPSMLEPRPPPDTPQSVEHSIPSSSPLSMRSFEDSDEPSTPPTKTKPASRSKKKEPEDQLPDPSGHPVPNGKAAQRQSRNSAPISPPTLELSASAKYKKIPSAQNHKRKPEPSTKEESPVAQSPSEKYTLQTPESMPSESQPPILKPIRNPDRSSPPQSAHQAIPGEPLSSQQASSTTINHEEDSPRTTISNHKEEPRTTIPPSPQSIRLYKFTGEGIFYALRNSLPSGMTASCPARCLSHQEALALHIGCEDIVVVDVGLRRRILEAGYEIVEEVLQIQNNVYDYPAKQFVSPQPLPSGVPLKFAMKNNWKMM